MELFSNKYVKIKDPNELISKDNLTDSDKYTTGHSQHNTDFAKTNQNEVV